MSTTTRLFSAVFGPEILRDYPNIDGVIGLGHQ